MKLLMEQQNSRNFDTTIYISVLSGRNGTITGSTVENFKQISFKKS